MHFAKIKIVLSMELSWDGAALMDHLPWMLISFELYFPLGLELVYHCLHSYQSQVHCLHSHSLSSSCQLFDLLSSFCWPSFSASFLFSLQSSPRQPFHFQQAFHDRLHSVHLFSFCSPVSKRYERRV